MIRPVFGGAAGVLLALFLVFATFGNHAQGYTIDEFGAVAGVKTLEVAHLNANAIMKALQRAATPGSVDRDVVIPAGRTYWIMNFPQPLTNIHRVRIRLDGVLLLWDVLADWDRLYDPAGYLPPAILLVNSSNLHWTGSGLFDGRGYDWWWDAIFGGTRSHDGRPTLLEMRHCFNIRLEHWRFRDPPMYTVDAVDVVNMTVNGVDIRVDVTKQEEILAKAGLMGQPQPPPPGVDAAHLRSIPLFPLNTDGIDFWGSDVVVHNMTVYNWDDVVCPKPCNPSRCWLNARMQAEERARRGITHHDGLVCTQNILAYDINITFGVGMTIGSVPPALGTNCIRDVVFRDVNFEWPLKAIYLKSNPTRGDPRGQFALIQNITYERMKIKNPLYWPLYASEQQQKQPDGYGTDCSFLYPFEPCPVNPAVTWKDIRMRDIEIQNSIYPGLLRLNYTNPGTGFHMENVRFTGDLRPSAWICENVETRFVNVDPRGMCIRTEE